jgi:cytochrome c-type biogenesis protein CcmE
MRNNSKFKLLLGAGILCIAGLMIYNLQLGDSLVLFYTPAEAVTQSASIEKKRIRVGAMVKQGTVKWNAETLELDFILSDLRETDISVRYKGTPPDMFKEGAGVVVEGRISNDGKSMTSDHLLVKHSEEYKKPGDHARLDPEAIKQEILKNESLRDQ